MLLKLREYWLIFLILIGSIVGNIAQYNIIQSTKTHNNALIIQALSNINQSSKLLKDTNSLQDKDDLSIAGSQLNFAAGNFYALQDFLQSEKIDHISSITHSFNIAAMDLADIRKSTEDVKIQSDFVIKANNILQNSSIPKMGTNTSQQEIREIFRKIYDVIPVQSKQLWP